MKVRESGMPDESVWGSFFDVPRILSAMEIKVDITDLAEIGFGYGTFTIPAAKIITGTLYAFDIEQKMAEITKERADRENLKNVEYGIRDIIEDTTGLPNSSVDYVMLFNILHGKDPKVLLKEAHRILKKNGKAGIIHWRSDIPTPRGPALDIRPKPDQLLDWIEKSKFQICKEPFILEPFHFGLILSSRL